MKIQNLPPTTLKKLIELIPAAKVLKVLKEDFEALTEQSKGIAQSIKSFEDSDSPITSKPNHKTAKKTENNSPPVDYSLQSKTVNDTKAMPGEDLSRHDSNRGRKGEFKVQLLNLFGDEKPKQADELWSLYKAKYRNIEKNNMISQLRRYINLGLIKSFKLTGWDYGARNYYALSNWFDTTGAIRQEFVDKISKTDN